MDNFQKFYDRTLRFLSYRPRSEKEIVDFLKKKKVEASIISKILARLKQLNFINDEEFTKWWVEQRTRFRPRGIRVIKMELRQKGVNPELIEKIISSDPASPAGRQFLISNKEAAKKLIKKRMTRLARLPKEQIYKKLTEFLLRRGFDWETVKNIVDEELKK